MQKIEIYIFSTLAIIAGDEPYVIMITEVIPKNQVNPIPLALLHLKGTRLN